METGTGNKDDAELDSVGGQRGRSGFAESLEGRGSAEVWRAQGNVFVFHGNDDLYELVDDDEVEGLEGDEDGKDKVRAGARAQIIVDKGGVDVPVGAKEDYEESEESEESALMV